MTASPTSSTVAGLIADAEGRLRAAGADSPELSALVLLEHASGLRREQILARGEATASAEIAERFNHYVRRRCAREPLAYIVGSREFFGRLFRVTPATLIPRPETEGLVELTLAHLYRHRGSVLYPTLLDVGTGCGAIAVSLLAELPKLQAVGTDIEPRALLVADENAERHATRDRLCLVACDLAHAVQGTFDLVIANLPYVPSAEIETLEPEVRVYEPRDALDGGADGTDHIRRLLQELPDLLQPAGIGLFEIGADQGPALTLEMARRFPGWGAGVEGDVAGIGRYLVVERPP